MYRRGGAGVDQVEGKVPIRHGIHAVGRQPPESELAANPFALKRKRRGRERSRAQRHLVRGLIRVPEAFGVAQQRLGMRQQVMADRDRLRALEVGVSRHHPTCMPASLGRESLDHVSDRGHERRCRHAAVQAEVQSHLVVARAARVQRGACRRELRQPALDCRVDVLVGVAELELTFVELALDPAQTALDRRQLRFRQKARRGQPARVGDAPGDVERIELEVDLERR